MNLMVPGSLSNQAYNSLFLMIKQIKPLPLYPHKYPHLSHSGYPVADNFNCSLPSAHRQLSSSCPLLFVFGWIAQFAQFPNQLNPRNPLCCLGCQLISNSFAQPAVVIRFWMNCAICAEWRSARCHPDERGCPGRVGVWFVAGSAMS